MGSILVSNKVGDAILRKFYEKESIFVETLNNVFGAEKS